jgi:hypothetical protein
MQMLEASERIADMKSAGAARVVALVLEDIENEVADFRAGFWPEEVFLDEEKQFYLALGGGQENRTYSLAGFVYMMLNPFYRTRIKDEVNTALEKGIEGNLTGEGFINGGVYVIRPDGKPSYASPEENMGDWASLDEVIEGVKAAVRGEVYKLARVVKGERGYCGLCSR